MSKLDLHIHIDTWCTTTQAARRITKQAGHKWRFDGWYLTYIKHSSACSHVHKLHLMVTINSAALAGVSVRSYTNRLHEGLRAHGAVHEVIVVVAPRERRAKGDDSNL